ncbi:MAG: hypothetical protein LAN83_05980 [Acidobacteriia bacterium]|nr:hypothetical protein [Terriglobia bacterium]
MNRWKWLLLIFELALFALILILPQVDLPDFTFHGGNAPVAARARLSSAPVRSATVVAEVERVSLPSPLVGTQLADCVVPALAASNSRLSLLCTRLC